MTSEVDESSSVSPVVGPESLEAETAVGSVSENGGAGTEPEFRPDPQAAKSRQFLVVSSVGVAVSIAAGLLANLPATFEFTSRIPAALSAVHWSIWACVAPAIFTLVCYGNDRLPENRRFVRAVFYVPTWTQLNTFGDQRIARVSYWALAIIPVSAYFVTANPLRIEQLAGLVLPLSVKLAFFISWFFSIALILFAVGCPKESRRRDHTRDRRAMNVVLNEITAEKIVIEQPQEASDPKLDRSALGLRALAFLAFLLGLFISVIVLFRSAWFVVSA